MATYRRPYFQGITNGQKGVRLLLGSSGPVAEEVMVYAQAPCSSGRRKRRNVSCLGLLLCLCLCFEVSAQEATPGFVSRLAPVAPMPALAQVAKANHIPLEQIDPTVETNRVSPGDSFTAVVALFSRRPETQWLLFLQGVEPTPKELKENPPRTMVIYNTLSHKLEFPSAPAFVALRTIGPFVAGETRKKPRDETTRFVLDQGYLGLGLEQAAAAILRMHRSGVKGPCMSGTDPFGDDVIGKCRKADETWHINPAEERALAGSLPALLSYFKTAQEAPELLDILAKALDRPSLWSLLWNRGISSTSFEWDPPRIAPADASEWQVSGRPAAYYCPMTLFLNHHPSLDLTLVVTSPQPPLLSCGGVLGLLAEKPGDKQIYLTLRIVSARLSATK
jgi:hypothetical protein